MVSVDGVGERYSVTEEEGEGEGERGGGGEKTQQSEEGITHTFTHTPMGRRKRHC